MIRALVSACIILYILVFPSPIHAARSVTISSNKTSLLGDEDMIVSASASGFTDGETIFIKGAFFQNGTTNYFGYTKIGDDWIKNSASNASQKSIKIGDWDGTLIVKSDFADSGYKGEGDYAFKLRFYYGSSFTADWSTNVVTIAINEPDPTITPTPTPTNTPTPTSTPSPTVTTAPTSVLSTSTPSIVVSLTNTIASSETIRGVDESSDPAILGVEDSVSSGGGGVKDASGAGLKTSLGLPMRSIIMSMLLVSIGVSLFSIANILSKVRL